LRVSDFYTSGEEICKHHLAYPYMLPALWSVLTLFCSILYSETIPSDQFWISLDSIHARVPHWIC
jgi:hypothetical protein